MNGTGVMALGRPVEIIDSPQELLAKANAAELAGFHALAQALIAIYRRRFGAPDQKGGPNDA